MLLIIYFYFYYFDYYYTNHEFIESNFQLKTIKNMQFYNRIIINSFEELKYDISRH